MKKIKYITKYFGTTAKQSIFIAVTVGTLAIITIGFLVWLNADNKSGIDEEKNIRLSPTMVESIKNTGQWEFLSINDEEMVDTISKGFFGNDELSRIYYGTLRFGIDTKDANISMEEDTVMVTLPKIKLLDNDFIDEARTKSFFETGSWNNNDREKLYKKAYKAMKARCLTKENTDMAEKNAILQMKNLFKSFGFEFVKVQFSK